jgi:sugar/nucleoside kinase (ribokinase family)
MRPDVCVIGEINPDLILYGVPENPQPERETLIEKFRLTLGSSAAIFAHNLAVLGTKVGMFSKIGGDPLGKLSLEWLASAGVDLSHVPVAPKEKPTGLTVILAKPDHRFILTYPGTMFDLSSPDLDLDYIFSARHLHLSSYFLQKSLQSDLPDLFREAKAKGLSTSLDTNDDPDDQWQSGLQAVLPFVDILFPNEREAKKIAGTDDLGQAMSKLSEICRFVVVKLGARGAIVRTNSAKWEQEAVEVQCVDPVGAGDSFDAGYIHRYLQGATPEECLEYAGIAGSFSTTCEGGTEAFRDRGNLAEFFRAHLTAR